MSIDKVRKTLSDKSWIDPAIKELEKEFANIEQEVFMKLQFGDMVKVNLPFWQESHGFLVDHEIKRDPYTREIHTYLVQFNLHDRDMGYVRKWVNSELVEKIG